jgi:hypothetical protein
LAADLAIELHPAAHEWGRLAGHLDILDRNPEDIFAIAAHAERAAKAVRLASNRTKDPDRAN